MNDFYYWSRSWKVFQEKQITDDFSSLPYGHNPSWEGPPPKHDEKKWLCFSSLPSWGLNRAKEYIAILDGKTPPMNKGFECMHSRGIIYYVGGYPGYHLK